MKLVSDQECDSLSRMSYTIPLSSSVVPSVLLLVFTGTHTYIVSPSHFCLYGSVGETIASTEETGLDKPDVLHTLCGVDLCQSLVRKLNCIRQSHVFQNTQRVHLALLGHTLALICKAVRFEKEAGRMFLGLLCLPVFPHLDGILTGPRWGAINGRKCPWCGYKRTSTPRWEDDGDLRQRRVTELRRDFLASSGEVKGENERMRWRREWPSTLLEPVDASVSGLSQKGVIEDKCKSLLCIVYSVLYHLSIMEKFLLVCRNYLPLSQQMYTRERTCCDSTKASGVSSHSPLCN